jgi:thioredoxin 1|tara:strand:+ start:80 stop:454 length:375 start_codon:yes stop_codon:yes gene_type:complete
MTELLNHHSIQANTQGVAMGAPKIVSDASFSDDVLMSEKPVVVDFWAEWCGPCKMVAPILEEIASENDSIVIAKLNVDENPQTAADYGITSIPTMNIYSGGQVVKTIIGAKPKAALLADLAEYL